MPASGRHCRVVIHLPPGGAMPASGRHYRVVILLPPGRDAGQRPALPEHAVASGRYYLVRGSPSRHGALG